MIVTLNILVYTNIIIIHYDHPHMTMLNMTLQIHRQELMQNLPLKPKLQECGTTRFLICRIILVAEMRAKNNQWTINKFTLHYCIVAIVDPVPCAIQSGRCLDADVYGNGTGSANSDAQ